MQLAIKVGLKRRQVNLMDFSDGLKIAPLLVQFIGNGFCSFWFRIQANKKGTVVESKVISRRARI
ncbi:MAG: hypothetical protein CMM66_10325 [Rhodospirillaceae bacterium]|nr:hypothetical protein [Rhodospirillaceae bacterium]